MDKTVTDRPCGAVERNDGTVAFTLYAPGKKSVHLTGNFNGWSRTSDPLSVDPDGFWTITRKLGKGEWTYQYFLDGETLVCDPYARLLAEGSEHDPPRAVVRIGAEPFAWSDGDWKRPPFADLLVYELHIGTFSHERTVHGVIGKLGYLAEFGVNCIELLPAYEFRGEHAWGYNPSYFFTVEKSYGEPDDLKRLVNEAHGRGIAVILDLVLAHSGHECPLLRMYPYDQSPWYGRGLGEVNQFGFPTFDFSKEGAKRFSRQVQRFWLDEFHLDGFRYDYLRGVGTRGGDGVPYVVKCAKEVADDLYLIGEYSPEEPGTVEETGLSGNWHVGISYDLKALLGEGVLMKNAWDDFDDTFGKLDAKTSGYASRLHAVNYVESHDEERLILDLVSAGMLREAARKKSALAASVLFTLPGPLMIYHGQEWGEDTAKTQEYNPLHWEFLETHEGRSLFDHYSRMSRLRKENGCLRSDDFRVEALYGDKKVAVYGRRNDEGCSIIVVLNFSPGEQMFTVNFPSPGIWKDLLAERGFRVESSLEFTLGGSDAAIFRKEG